MRFIRFLLTFLLVSLGLAALLAAVAISPIVQTWVAERALARYYGGQASIGSVSAGFSAVRVTDLRLQLEGAVLTLPALEANLPLKAALWDRQVRLRALVAKGWTLDLSHQLTPAEKAARLSKLASPAEATPTPPPPQVIRATAQDLMQGFRALLGAVKLPPDSSLDGLDLEGDVLLATSADQEPARAHLTLKGGGLAAGRDGDFAVDATCPMEELWPPPSLVAVHGQLKIAIGAARSIERVEFEGSVSSPGGPLPDKLGLTAQIVTADHVNGDSYRIALTRENRHVVSIAAHLSKTSLRYEGTWQVDFRDSDLLRFYSGRPLPSLIAAGEGNFTADATLANVQTTGRLQAAVDGLSGIAPALGRLGAAKIEVGFELTHTAQSLHVGRLDVSVTGVRPIASARAVQPFSVDERTGALTVADPLANWLEGTLQGLPVAWLSGLARDVSFAGGDATGDFVVQASKGEFAVQSKAPLVATGVSAQKGGAVLAQGIDLSLALSANVTARNWQVHASPLIVGSGGRNFATIEAKVAPLAEGDRRLAVAGKWSADLDALASQTAIPGLRWVKGRSATGDLSATVSTATEVKSKLNVVGHSPGVSLSADVRAYIDAQGAITFRAPVTFSVGTNAAEFSAEGMWAREKGIPRIDLELSAVKLALEPLLPLAAVLSKVGGLNWPTVSDPGAGGLSQSAGARDLRPFWGEWSGHVRFGCYQLQAGAYELHEVAGTVAVDRGSLHLERGRGTLALASPSPPTTTDRIHRPTKPEPPRSVMTLEGLISFDAAADLPYQVKAAGTIDGIDAARLFTVAQAEHDPVVEGRFSVADTITGSGNNLPDLLARRREEIHLASKGGIIRLLKTSVAESIPEKPSPVSDTLATVGSALGSLFGLKGGSTSPVASSLSKETEAVLNFTYQVPEIRYEQLTLTAIRETDRSIQLAEIVMTATNERLTGSGHISYVKGLPLRAQPLALDLRLGARGNIATLLSTAGLLTSEKDDQGYTLFRHPLHFGGSLEQVDPSQWREVLVKAATQKPDRSKKGG